MSHRPIQRLIGPTVCASAFGVTAASAQAQSADACFADKDAACLEAMFADIVTDPSPEKSKAIVLLGQLQSEAGDFAAAKDTFLMGTAFGGGDPAQQALMALFDAQPEVFTDPADCLALDSDACFMRIIETGSPDESASARYLFGAALLVDDPVRGTDMLETVYAEGNLNAACPLQEIYRDGAEGVPADFNKSVTVGFDCLFDQPFANLDQDHFAKYEGISGHKAYALAENGLSSYSEGIVDPDVAARLAKDYCDNAPSRKDGGPECFVINIDGVWVEDIALIDLPDFAGGEAGLITVSALESYRDKFVDEEGVKVFVQSKNGSWSWRSQGQSDKTLETLTADALENCGKGWRHRLEYPCEVINIDGEWIE